MADMPPPPQQDVLSLAKKNFNEGKLGEPCITELADFLQPNNGPLYVSELRAFILSELREGVLPSLERYYIRGAESGFESVLNPTSSDSSEKSVGDAFEAEGLACDHPDLENQRERLNSLIRHLERSFPSETVKGALDILRGHERELFEAGYNFGQAQAQAQALLPETPGSARG
jgi:hypothetical protein